MDEQRLNQYLGRQVRRHLRRMHMDNVDGFCVSEKAYRYDDHGIYLAIKEKRKRIFISLTDNNRYTKQLYIRIFPEDGNIVIHAPVETKIRQHEDYQYTLAEYVREGNIRYHRNDSSIQLDDLFKFLSDMCRKNPRPIVLIIDEGVYKCRNSEESDRRIWIAAGAGRRSI